VLDVLANEAKNGIVISGLVAWMKVQRDTNPEGIWMTVAMEQWNDSEIFLAKKALESVTTVEWIKTKIKPYIYTERQGVNKKKAELQDIKELLELFYNQECMPLILATSDQVKAAPQFWGEPKTHDVSGVMEEIKVLKNTLSDYIQGNNRQISEIRRDISSTMSMRSRSGSFLRWEQQSMFGTPTKIPRME
jgi:hypothetical protein